MKFALTTTIRVVALFALSSTVAFAQEAITRNSDNWGWGVGAGLAIGLAALGGGFGQGKSASAALEGMARNPQAAGNLQTPLILALVFTVTRTRGCRVSACRLAGLF